MATDHELPSQDGAPDGNALVHLDHIRFSYDNGATWILDDISLTVHAGERICIIGANGSGKSTLSRLIAGLEAPDHGTVTLMGERVFDDEHGAYPDAYRKARRHLGAVFQNPADQIVATRTEDDIAFGPENLAIPRDQIGPRVSQALDDVHMEDDRLADPTHMSGGQQQRVAIAGMLAMHSHVLVLDEPTAMLDPAARSEIMAVLDRVQRHGTAIVLVTHHHEETASADRILRVTNGHLETVSYEQLRSEHDRSIHHDANTSESTDFLSNSSTPPIHDASSAASDVIRFDHVSFRYPNASTDALHDCTLAIRHGETVAITGVNGSGKTTFARLLCALETPSSGTITIDGITVASPHGSRERRASRRQRDELHRRVGFVMQHAEHQLFEDTVAHDVAFGPHAQHLSDAQVKQRVRESLELLRIGDLADRAPLELSVGQQRLVAIAGVLACHPSILVLDEPTAGLDECARQRLIAILRGLHHRGFTIVIVTHRSDEAETLADRTIEFTDPPLPAGTQPIHDPLDSWMGRLDPRVKILGSLVLMFSAFAMGTFMQLACGIAITAVLVILSRIGAGQLLRRIHGFLALFVLFGALNIFVIRTGHVLMRAGPVLITVDGIYTAILYAARFSLVIIIAAVLLATTMPTAMTEAFATILHPLRIFGVHVQEIALVFSLAVRFLPILASEALAIRDAQACRGGSIESGALVERIRALCAVIVPVFTAALRHADTLSLALDARCYEDGMPRTRWRVLSTAKQDWMFIGLVMLQIVVIAACAIW